MKTESPDRGRTRWRVALAGVLGAAVLGGGAGMAYAGEGPGSVVETGFATVVDESNRPADTAGSAGPGCPVKSEAEGTGAR